MNQKLKAMYRIATNDPTLAIVASIMLDLLTGRADDRTIQQAAKLEVAAPSVWRENQWLRMVGGTEPGGMVKNWQQYLVRELDDESKT